MDIWAGSISAESDSPSLPLEDLRLSTPSSATTPPSVLSHLNSSLSSARLSLISFIDPTRIPLFLAAGPSLELTTTSPVTASYFRKLFLSRIPTSANDVFDGRTAEQSRIALLVRVTNDQILANGSWKVTELAIYGAITYLTPPGLNTPLKGAELTPPNSSPGEIPTPRAIVTVHALPLSSQHAFLSHLPPAKQEPQSPTSQRNYALILPDDSDAVFIAPNPQDILNPSISQSAKKRGAAVLDAAADPRKRAKRPSVPARPPPLSLLGGVVLNRKVRAESADPRNRGTIIKRERSPSPTPSFAPSLTSKRSFSGGNRLPLVKRRNSSIALTETPREGSVRPSSSSAIKKEVYGEIETKNRAELAKVVVAGMRSCGLRDYRNNRGKLVLPGAAAGEEDSEDCRERGGEREREKEEYKQIYHHTVKAAAFALRNVISVGSVETDKMREVVDRLLGMFCEPKTGQLLLEAAAGAEVC